MQTSDTEVQQYSNRDQLWELHVSTKLLFNFITTVDQDKTLTSFVQEKRVKKLIFNVSENTNKKIKHLHPIQY